MELYVYSRGLIERVQPHEVPHVIISITSHVDDVARLPISAECRGVLRLAFPDANGPSESFSEEQLFSRAQAREVWSFVLAHRDAIERLVVHCDAGQCRSPAVAAAVAKVFTNDDAEYFRRYRPNSRVHRMLLETYYDEFDTER